MFRRNTSEKSHSQHHLNIGSPLERSGSNSSVHFESNESGPELENSLSAKNWGLAKKCIAQGHGTSRHGLVHKAVKAQAPVEILEAMVEKGASVDETLEGKWTPLHVAAKYDASVSVVGFLVQSGALINTTLTTGETPLFIAVERDNEAVVEFLIGAGADANIARSSDGMTPLQVMVYKHAIPGQSPPWLMEVLIKKASANVNESSKDGTTALLIAIQKGATELVESLIQAGADVFTPKNSGDTPLIIALQNGCSLRLVELLLKAGADVNKANLNGESPISIAAQKNVDVSVMDLLIRAGGDVNRPTGSGLTPVLGAILEGASKELVALLVSHGADVTHCRFQRLSAYELAQEKGFDHLLEVLNPKSIPSPASFVRVDYPFSFCTFCRKTNVEITPCQRCNLVAYCGDQCKSQHRTLGHGPACGAVYNLMADDDDEE